MQNPKLKIQNLSSWTIFIFGLLALVLGLIGLIRPETTLSLLNLEVIERTQRGTGDHSLGFLVASSMASFNMGIYYVLASLNNLKVFYSWTVPFRIVTFSVFILAVANGIAPTGFIAVGIWELVGALATGATLLYERNRGKESS